MNRSLSFGQDDFETFTENPELNLEYLAQRNQFLVEAMGYFMLNQATDFSRQS